MNPIEEIVKALNDGVRPIPEEFSTTEKMIDLAFEQAKAILMDGNPQSELYPTWQLLNNKGNAALLVTPFNDGEKSKDLAALGLQLVMKMTGCIRYTFACEAWMATGSPGEKWDGRPVSSRDDRIEVLMINGADRERGLMKSWEIIRGDTGAIIDLKPHWTQGDGPIETQGRFANLLEDIDA